MLQWPAQLPIAGGNHRFQCARVQRGTLRGGGLLVAGTLRGPENRKFVRIENVQEIENSKSVEYFSNLPIPKKMEFLYF